MRLACLLVLAVGCGDNGAAVLQADAAPPCTPGLRELVTPDLEAAAGIAAGFLDLGRSTDLVVARSNDVAVLLGKGHHAFAPAPSYTAFGASAVALADLDRDGKLDLVVGAPGGIDLARGNGDGTFTSTGAASSPTQPLSIAVADLDLDGDLDLVTSGAGGSSLGLYLLDNGQVTVASAVPVGPTPGRVVIADVDGDDYPDLVVTESGVSPGVVSVLWGGPGATFSAPQDLAVPSLPFSAAVGDVTGDGHLDLVVADGGAGVIDVLRGDGHRHFAAPVLLPTQSHMPWSVAIGDIDQDRIPDIVVGGMGTLEVFHGDGSGGFGPSDSLATMDVAPRTLLLADIDDDRLLDVVMSDDIGAPQVVYGACVR